ncbi:hypothetical protein [Mitsuaria sp. 7]|uniref:hypothetical protein n=1 Tax=Mitsuaria sp. 7 TaxID=1658665 RepID=UPI0007DDC8CC|nr:hypothetical protein [Mitsuaria sp. 7]ANH68305.1 hypothetical protein ABE85_13345 [Mitsuaria sp. 7]
MAAPERTVRRLRLRAPGEAAVRRILPTLEDALRCASLGDDGGRLIVVRKLALGRVTAGATSQALSRVIEEKAAAVSRQWVAAAGDASGLAVTDGDDGAADYAGCVVFAGVLEARLQLAGQLLRGRRADAWYWPLAVPEFDVTLPARRNLARIAFAIAHTPEGRVALPQWTAALVRGVGTARVALCFDDDVADRLLDLVGLAPGSGHASAEGSSRRARTASDDAAGKMRMRADPSASASTSNSTSASTSAAPSDAADGDDALVPRWLRRLLEAAGSLPPANHGREAEFRAPSTDLPPGSTAASARWNQCLPVIDRRDDGTASREGSVDRSDPALRSTTPHESASMPIGARRDAPSASRLQEADETDDARDACAPLSSDAWPWLQPTRCGGLLFLLPVLVRLGVPQRAPDDEAACRLVAAVLRLALQRSHAPRDDPMWQVATAAGADAMPEAEAADAAGILADARRWLHRAGRIGLVRLVRRRGQVCATATHVDLHFTLDQCDLRLRRLGLDLDPGWVPWFGRVVAFHYGASDA